jgi:hypothetical protein
MPSYLAPGIEIARRMVCYLAIPSPTVAAGAIMPQSPLTITSNQDGG